MTAQNRRYACGVYKFIPDMLKSIVGHFRALLERMYAYGGFSPFFCELTTNLTTAYGIFLIDWRGT